jgi:uncharacterized membrane protein YvbJ
MFCTNCGNKIELGEKFCTSCGQTVNSSGEKNAPKTNVVKTESNTIKQLLKICLWVALVGFGIWLIVALGPLWIIAIILLLILFVVANK